MACSVQDKDKKTENMIGITNASLVYDKEYVFRDLDFCAKKGKLTALVGNNGTGKSSIAFILAGVIPKLVKADVEGNIDIKGNCSLILQNPSSQFLATTVKDELKVDEKTIRKYGLQHLMKKTVFDLSEGEKQKVNLVSQLSSNSTVIILDEPLELLDPAEAKRFAAVIVKIRKEKTILWLDKDELFLDQINPDSIIRLSERKKRIIEKKEHKLGGVVINTNFSYAKNSFKIKIMLNARKNERIAIIGRNGSGKTTLLKTLVGALKADGKVNVRGNMGFMPQNPSHLLFEETVEDELALTGNVKTAKTLEIIRLLKNDPAKLSKGQQKIVSLGAAVSDIMLLDEPTTWLDPKNKEIVYDFINNYEATMIMATHDRELLKYCDTIYIIEGGELRKCSNTMINRFFQG